MPESGPSEEILTWAKTQPLWRQDALRRLLTGPFTGKDEDECFELLKAAHGLVESAEVAVPLDAQHLPIRSTSASNLRLVSLDQIANVNRLANDASLAFAATGLTLIYGDNGSGKTGFIRIFKNACRARDHEQILQNVFAPANRTPASARFVIADGKAEEPIIWSDGAAASDKLGRFAVFDSRCAGVHVDEENRLEVIPHNLDCFEKLAQVCDRIRARLKAEAATQEAQLQAALPQPPANSAATRIVASLRTATEQALEAAAVWAAENDSRLGALSEMLKDPTAEAQRLERLAESLKDCADSLAGAADLLSDSSLERIDTLRKSADQLRGAANLNASAAFLGEPLGHVGEDPWRILFDAARAYSEQHAYPGEAFPVVSEDSVCVLCQQSLADASRHRLRRFSDFVTGSINEKAQKAEAERDDTLQQIRPFALKIPELAGEAKDYLTLDDPPLATDCGAFQAALLQRRMVTLNTTESPHPLPTNPVTALRAKISILEKSAADARALATSTSATADALRAEHLELLSRKYLSDNKEELKRRIKVFAILKKIDGCMEACGTKQISDQGSKLLKVHITETLATALENEQKALGIQSIPLAMSDRTPKGAIHHKLRLNGATMGADTSAVLSEGEHRAVALAAFLSELSVFTGKDAIIIDDPVSSLDHQRRSKVAERLVAEAVKRQVIVFTHDLVFLAECRYLAARDAVPLRVLGIRRGAEGFGSADPDGEPWQAKAVSGRRQWLLDQLSRLKRLHEQNDPQYEVQLRFFYDRLRESWEKLIEEKLFAQVVQRFLPQVQTQRLREAVIDDDLASQVYFGMTAVSNYTGHDRAAAKGAALADPDECKKDLDAFIKCLSEADAKSKATAKARESMQKAPKG